jgi:hypothetical protein
VLACFRCRAEIPGDSQFCPLCGARTADVDGADTQRDAFSLGEGPTDIAESPSQAPAVPERRTVVMAPASPQMLGPPGPGQPGPPIPYAWAPPTPPSAPIPHPHPHMIAPPGGAAEIPVTPSPVRIGFGVMLAIVALIMAVSVLPRLGDDVTVAGRVIAAVVGAVGILFIVLGMRHRAHAEVMCRRCRRPVIAWKGAFGLHCPLGPHLARVDWPVVVLTAGFWTGALVVTIVGLALFL